MFLIQMEFYHQNVPGNGKKFFFPGQKQNAKLPLPTIKVKKV